MTLCPSAGGEAPEAAGIEDVCPSGVVAELPDVARAPLEAPDSSGPGAGVLAGVGAGVAAAVALGGTAWYGRWRWAR